MKIYYDDAAAIKNNKKKIVKFTYCVFYLRLSESILVKLSFEFHKTLCVTLIY